MNHSIRIDRWALVLAAVVLSAAAPASASAQIFDFGFVPATAQNWNVAANWFDQTNGINAVPDATSFDMRANIGSGGTAIVQTPNPPSPGAVIITNGTATINSGATLSTMLPPGLLVDGSVYLNRGANQTATLNVLPGGTLTAIGPLLSAGNVANVINIGGAAVGTATVNVPAASFNGLTRVYPNAAFAAAGSVTFGAPGTYQPEISGASAASLNIGQNAKLGGTLNASFTGAAPAVGATWQLMQADAIQGAFANVTSTLSLPANQRLMTRVVPITGQRQRLDLELAEVLVLTVNRDSGVVRITHPGGSNIALDAYTVASSQGRIATGAWNSLTDQNAFGGSWNEAATSMVSISELRPSGNGTAAGGANVSLGPIYNSLGGTFAATSADITFTYSDKDGRVVNGVVNYVGTTVNNLLLQIDPTTGQARLRNPSSTTVNIDGYAISSAASLTPGTWNSLDDQNVAGGDWLEGLAPTSALIAEFKSLGTTTLAPNSFYNLGTIFNPAAARDVTFEFAVPTQEDAIFGAVVYQTISTADFNGDGLVNGGDFLIWQRGAGISSGASAGQGDANGDGAVNAADLTIWKSQYGQPASETAASPAVAAVPEPTGVLLAAVGLMAATTLGGPRRGSRAKPVAAAGN